MTNLQSQISNLKYIIILLGLIMLTWLLPALYELLSPRTDKTPFVLYSCLDSTFIRFETHGKQIRYVNSRGEQFTKAQTDSLLPLFSFRQLVAEGRLPDSLFGVALTPKLIQQNTFHFKTSPKQLNKPAVGLYTMLESASGRVDLTLPSDVFRLTEDGLEFIDCETNTINRAKSLSFSRELTKHGFTFPVHLIWENGTTRKDYDNGFLLTDANDRLFQLKMVKGTPFVREIDRTNANAGSNTRFTNVFVIEPANRALIGLVVDENHRLYAVRSNATLAPIGKLNDLLYSPQEMQITIVGDLFHWTITEYTATDSRYYAVDANTFELVASEIIPDPERPLAQRLERILLPIRLRFTSWRTQLIRPNINDD